MVLILAVIAAVGAGVIGVRASTDYHTQLPPQQAAAEQASLATPATNTPAGAARSVD